MCVLNIRSKNQPYHQIKAAFWTKMTTVFKMSPPLEQTYLTQTHPRFCESHRFKVCLSNSMKKLKKNVPFQYLVF